MPENTEQTQGIESNPVIPFGVRLTEARVSLNLTLEELTTTLNLDVSILEALENSALDKLPPAIYVQGYIKAYTKALGISSDEIHNDYLISINQYKKSELKPRSPLPIETNSESPVVRIVTILLVVMGVLAVLFGIYNYYSSKLEESEVVVFDDVLEKSMDIEQTTSIPFIKIKQNARLTEDGDLIVDNEVSSQIKPELITVLEVTNKKDPIVIKKKDEKTPILSVKQDDLMVSAVEKSWVVIHDDEGKRIYYGLLQDGRSLQLKGQAPFDIILGNARGIELAVNGVNVEMINYIRENNSAHFRVSEKSKKIVFQ